MEMTLYQLTEQQAAIEDALYANGGEATPELEQMLAESKAALPAKIDGYNHILARMRSMEDACAAEIARLQALKKTAQNGQKYLKAHLLDAMQTFGIDKLEGSTCKVYRKATGPSVEITDDGLLWNAYAGDLAELQKRLPPWLSLERKADKTAIKSALQSGELIAGAELHTDGQTIVIK